MSLVAMKALIPTALGPLLQDQPVFLEGRGPQSPTTELDTYQEGPYSPHAKKILSLKKVHTNPVSPYLLITLFQDLLASPCSHPIRFSLPGLVSYSPSCTLQAEQ